MKKPRRSPPRTTCAHCGGRIHAKNDDYCFRCERGICARCGRAGRICAPMVQVHVPGIGGDGIASIDARVLALAAETFAEKPGGRR